MGTSSSESTETNVWRCSRGVQSLGSSPAAVTTLRNARRTASLSSRAFAGIFGFSCHRSHAPKPQVTGYRVTCGLLCASADVDFGAKRERTGSTAGWIPAMTGWASMGQTREQSEEAMPSLVETEGVARADGSAL